jgi:membrane peptidoglycan carboxypeptidase
VQTLRIIWAVFISLVLSAAAAFAVFATHWLKDLPDYRQLDTMQLSGTTRIYARNGSLIGTLSPSLPGGGSVDRTVVALNQVSPYLIASVVTSEDHRFFYNYGVDPIGMLRGLISTLFHHQLQGGSTLTNQLVKSTLLASFHGARTLRRKVKEAVLSLEVGRKLTKNEILQDYLNVIYWGANGNSSIVGAYAAAKAYFGVPPSRLSLAQSVYLTTLIPAPARYYHYPAYRPLMHNLLQRMVKDGWISQSQAKAAFDQPIEPSGWKIRYGPGGQVLSAQFTGVPRATQAVSTEQAPYFMQQVKLDLLKRFGRHLVYGSGGLDVITTLSPQAQAAMDQASLDAVLPPGATLGMVAMQPQTGQVLAMVGQKLYPGKTPPQWNNAVNAYRQIGSSIKPFLYTTALGMGFTQLNTEPDFPATFPCVGCPGGVYKPHDYDYIYQHRDVTLRYALDHSLNLPTLHLLTQVGIPNLVHTLHLVHLPVYPHPYLALGLGALQASPLQMAAAYSVFADQGVYHRPSYLLKVTTASGKVLYDAKRTPPKGQRVFSPQLAYMGLNMMLGYVNDLTMAQGGLGQLGKVPGWQTGGKTGTSNSIRDLWFDGVTPKLVISTWVGREDDQPMRWHNSVYVPSSSYVNPPIFRQAAAGALAGQTPVPFKIPPGIIFRHYKNDAWPLAFLAPNGSSQTAQQTSGLSTLPLSQKTVVVSIDRRTGYLASPSTPSRDIVQRQVPRSELAQFSPPGSAP